MEIPAIIEKLQKYAVAQNDTSEQQGTMLQEAAQQVSDELLALQSIFGEENVGVAIPVQGDSDKGVWPSQDGIDSNNGTSSDFDWSPDQAIRIFITVPMDVILGVDEVTHGDAETSIPSIKVSATLPPGYPQVSTPPQLQLLSRYIGSHGVDHFLFGQVLRIFHQGSNLNDHVEFQPGEVILFDGIEKVREKVEDWYGQREAERIQRKEEDDVSRTTMPAESTQREEDSRVLSMQPPKKSQESVEVVKDIMLFSAPAITERKSVFVGHCAYLDDASQVPLILSKVLQDRKVARATHPTIHAWVCKSKETGVIHRDCDDDGETAAGGRLAHLLDLLHLENVIVIVTRWYGGVQLGPDRFKLINRAGRDALEVAQLVSGPLNPNNHDTKSSNKKP